MCVTNNPRRKITMDNNISRIGSAYFKPEYKVSEDKGQEKNAENQEQAKEKQQKQVSSNEVLGFMAAQNADLIPLAAPKTVDPSKYVTNEQEARIAEFMKNFEADYDEAFAIAKGEFPEVSDQLAGDLALSYINASY